MSAQLYSFGLYLQALLFPHQDKYSAGHCGSHDTGGQSFMAYVMCSLWCLDFALDRTWHNILTSCIQMQTSRSLVSVLANFQEELELLGTVTARLCRCLCHAPTVGAHERSHQVRHFCVPSAAAVLV